MLVSVTSLKLLNDILVTLDCASHFFLKIIKLSFEFLSFALLQTHLHNLLIKIMFYEFHFKKDITCLINSVLRRIKIGLVPILTGLLILFVSEA